MKNLIPYSAYNNRFAKKLRKEMTFAEVLFWKQVRNYSMMGYDFHRQIPILRFIADFYCKDLKLVIEIDGITHLEEEVAKKDLEKENELKKKGLHVMRFSDREIIKDIENVKRAVLAYIENFEENYGIDERVQERREKMRKGLA